MFTVGTEFYADHIDPHTSSNKNTWLIYNVYNVQSQQWRLIRACCQILPLIWSKFERINLLTLPPDTYIPV